MKARDLILLDKKLGACFFISIQTLVTEKLSKKSFDAAMNKTAVGSITIL